jgi:hypothetical protein
MFSSAFWRGKTMFILSWLSLFVKIVVQILFTYYVQKRAFFSDAWDLPVP